ncbi:Rtr1/RPAP2 family-domain-containing protein [Xylariaceae sp. FL1651]|nr:Rtr1/RPAP2 family-domain-containing protein [Xylariaceae sp. FL1651]
MSTQAKKPKGILKKPSTTPSPISTADTPQPDPREIAVQHARIIHSRREVEDKISDSLIELSKLPLNRGSPYNASDPAPSDADTFKTLVRLYQPSDYDDLIEERNANGLCGYTLCANPRLRVTGGGTFKLVNYGRKDFNIVPKRELEKWCSQKCAKRAMYVKVQLNETAAWERAGIASIQIELLEEEAQGSATDAAIKQLARDTENLKIEAQNKTAQNARDLALERGDDTENRRASKRPVKVTIREKTVKTPAEEPSLGADGQDHLVTEGYKTTFDPKSETVNQEDNNTEVAETTSK